MCPLVGKVGERSSSDDRWILDHQNRYTGGRSTPGGFSLEVVPRRSKVVLSLETSTQDLQARNLIGNYISLMLLTLSQAQSAPTVDEPSRLAPADPDEDSQGEL